MLIFIEGGKMGNPEKNPHLIARERTNKLNSHEVPELRIKSTTHLGPQW
jgi:hypothetical protein